MASQVRLRLLPSARCLFSEPIQVKVAGLGCKQVVTMRAESLDEKKVVFSSAATYRADERGEIDLNRDPSLSGSYVGVEPMGLLWSMSPQTPGKKFRKINSLTPHCVKLSVHEAGDGKMLAEVINERHLLGEQVKRVPIQEGKVRGVLFIPPGTGPFPALLDLYTLGAGLSERRASLLASRGFVVLTVALFGNEENMSKFHLDYFEEALNILRAHDKVVDKGVGVIAISKSGDLALSMASFLPGIKATVCINSCSANTGFPLLYREKQILPPLAVDLRKAKLTESGVFMCKPCLHSPFAEENKATLVPIEQAEGHFLFVASEEDLNWDSKAFMEQMVERLKHHGKENFECVCYPGAGHYLEPPYGPFCTASIHPLVGKPVLWGGDPRSHSAAEVHLWKKIQEFFRTHLDRDDPRVEAKL